MDALIALLLVVAVVLLIDFTPQQPSRSSIIQGDVMEVLSNVKISETNNSYVRGLIASGKIKNTDSSILEQIGELYALGDEDARNLALEFLRYLDKDNIGIWINDELVASKNSTPYDSARNVWTSRQIISGVQKGNNITGFSSRAYLTKNILTKYFYFGGYVGDGNLSALVSYSGNIKSASIEAAINKNFTLYINNQLVGAFSKANNSFEPVVIDLSGHLGKFVSGDNLIEFRGEYLYIAGGYISIGYETEVNYKSVTRYSFPGIDGFINLYDSFYIPGSLNGMEIYLHYNVTVNPAYLTIGNTTVFNTSYNGEAAVTISNAQLDALLDYSLLSNRTIPVRFGLVNMTLPHGLGNADVVLITDLSGSMDWQLNNESAGIARNCNDSNIYNSTTKRISLAKCLDKNAVDVVLSNPGNRIALVGFYADDSSPYKGRIYEQGFTNDKSLLYSSINNYTIEGGTCICCAINDAWALFNEQSSSNRSRFVIVMSDGIPTHSCAASSSCEGDRTGRPSEEGLWLGWGSGCWGGSDDCSVNDCSCASQNANWSACRVYNSYNATVYSIGFGPIAACAMANSTLRNVAQCGRGKYYTSDNASFLKEIYDNVSSEIVGLSYTEQIIAGSGSQSRSRLYPDSYISFNYTQKDIPYGIAISYQSPIFGNNISEGSFDVPLNSTVVEANALSYSASKWTDNVTLVNSGWRFLLSDFGNEYGVLGDPYVVNIPERYVSPGINNVVIKTAISPYEIYGGSRFNKIAYTIVRSFLTYSPVKMISAGCSWNISFEDGSSEIIKVPGGYTGSRNCVFSPGLMSYNPNDATDISVYELLKMLDVDDDDLVDMKLSQEGMGISSVEVTGIPFTWSSEVQVRVWR